jgi:hypothetical protein
MSLGLAVVWLTTETTATTEEDYTLSMSRLDRGESRKCGKRVGLSDRHHTGHGGGSNIEIAMPYRSASTRVR